MPTKTFLNLSDDKKMRIEKALLQEFSTHSLAKAQVAPIVKAAGIARGAFYTYFTDLQDAYQYEFSKAMQVIHQPFSKKQADFTIADILLAIKDFAAASKDSEYGKFIRLYYQKNQYLLPDNLDTQLPDKVWGQGILIHQTVKDVILHPENETTYLARLRVNLEKLSNKEGK